MQRDTYAVAHDRLAVLCRFEQNLLAQARAHQRRSGRRGHVYARSRAQMIGVGMRDDGAVHWLPGVDVEVAGVAVQSAFRQRNHRASAAIRPGKASFRIAPSLVHRGG